jgi:hypothetical protein
MRCWADDGLAGVVCGSGWPELMGRGRAALTQLRSSVNGSGEFIYQDFAKSSSTDADSDLESRQQWLVSSSSRNLPSERCRMVYQ